MKHLKKILLILLVAFLLAGTTIAANTYTINGVEISYETFSGCNQLTDISFGDGSNFTAKNGAVLDQSKNNLIYCGAVPPKCRP